MNFKGGGTSFNTIRNHWREVEERCAPLQVEVAWSFEAPVKVQPASGITAGNIDAYIDNAHINGSLSSEAQSIICEHGSHDTQLDCHVFYVREIDLWTGSSVNAHGVAIWIGQPAALGGYGNNLFLASSAHILTPAHELGHLLRNGLAQPGSSHHTSDEQNIMLAGDGVGDLQLDSTTGVKDSKRFDEWQKARVESNVSNLLEASP